MFGSIYLFAAAMAVTIASVVTTLHLTPNEWNYLKIKFWVFSFEADKSTDE